MLRSSKFFIVIFFLSLGIVEAQTHTVTVDRVHAENAVVIAPVGDVVMDPGGKDVYPNRNYDVNLGLINKKWLTIHAAELWVETLVAKDNMSTIGGRLMIGPTTFLTQDLDATSTTIWTKHNNLAVNDTVVLQSAPGGVAQTEFMLITGTVGSATLAIDGNASHDAEYNSSTLTWSHTVGSGLNRLLLVSVGWQETLRDITGVTFNGLPLTEIGTTISPNHGAVSMWYLIAPPTGAFNIVATFDGVCNPVGGATVWTNVNQSTPYGSVIVGNAGLGTAPTGVVTGTSVGNVLVDAVMMNMATGTMTPNAGQTMRVNRFAVGSGGLPASPAFGISTKVVQ